MELAAEVLSSLREESAAEITSQMSAEELVELFDYMEPDDATDVVELLPEDLRQHVLARIRGEEELEDLTELLAWPSDSAGGIMSPEVFIQHQSRTCGQSISELQERHEELENAFYLYVIDEESRLVGVVSLRSLLVHPPSTPLVSIMTTDIIAVRPRTDQEEVARVVARYDILAVPVVDQDSRLLGIVTVDDVIDVIREEAVEDMMLMAGVAEEYDLSGRSTLRLVRDRVGWLLATAFGGIVADRITHFQGEALPMEVLAGLIPVVMGMGGNVGIQSTTIAVRGLATGHVQIGGAIPFVWREARVAMVLGLIYGLGLGLYGLATGWPDPFMGITAGVSVFLAIGLGGLLGSALPVALSRFGVDPAIATGPFVTTSVDIIGIFIYFSVARIVLGLG